MHTPFTQYAVMASFRCLGAQCPDTCCRGWDMPVDARQRQCYTTRAPELLATIDPQNNIMKRTGDQQQCAQLCEGSCAIHASYGDEFLSDACHFYPRLLHAVGDGYMMAGAVSCPEMLRLILTEKEPFAAQVSPAAVRMPIHRRDVVPTGWTPDGVQAVIAHAMHAAGDGAHAPEACMAYLLHFAQLLAPMTAGDAWPQAAKNARHTLDGAQPLASDGHGVYYALALLEAFGEPNVSVRLGAIMARMEQALDCRFDRATRSITMGQNAAAAYSMLQHRWRMDAQQALAPVLRRWLQAQVAMTAFPFGGFQHISMAERAAVLVQRFATIRLALMCHVDANAVPPDEETVMRVIQGISRFMDHIADADLTQMIHRDCGWQSEARLRGLVMG
jgi:hypothetical protein